MRKTQKVIPPPVEVSPLRECSECHQLLAIDISTCPQCMTELPSFSQIFPLDVNVSRLLAAARAYQSEADNLNKVIADINEPIASFDEFVLRLYLIFQHQWRVVEFLRNNGFKLPGKKEPGRQVVTEDLMLMMDKAEKSPDVTSHLRHVVKKIKVNFHRNGNHYLDC